MVVAPQSNAAEEQKRSGGPSRAEEKAREMAQKMRPRNCKLPECGKEFVPKRPQDWKSEFCCKEHQQQFWVDANRISATALKTGTVPTALIASQSEFRIGMSHKAQVLALLEKAYPGWVEHPKQLLPGVSWNVISKLRQDGYEIETREVGQRPYEIVPNVRPNWRKFLPGGNVEYQYRLISKPEPK